MPVGKTSVKDTWGKSLEYVCSVTSLSPIEDFLWLRVLGLLEYAPVVRLTVFLAPPFSRAAQDLKDQEVTGEIVANL